MTKNKYYYCSKCGKVYSKKVAEYKNYKCSCKGGKIIERKGD